MERVGFIGLGTMGKPMARRLLQAGYPLAVHNRSRGAVDELAKEGAEPAASPKQVAQQCDILITMLPDSPDVEQVILGKEGAFEGDREGMLFVDMSTISPVTARRLAAEASRRHVDMLDAPVSGGEIGAINGTLSIMVGGKQNSFERALPLFQTMGKNIVLIGEAGAGQVAKAANQIVVALTIEAVAEALVLAAKAGVDPGKVRQALLGGFAQSRVLDVHGQRMLDQNFRPGFRTNLHFKDLGIALAAGKEYAVPLPVTAAVYEMMNALIAAGDGNLDHSSLVTLIERVAHAELRTTE
ncbi:MAG: 2-hydroxy-3-oxopropionate reductase [Chloroflexi bacterium]|nr:2-hydroxy-3-oxopropionate reductase [Chloroflexota bacterium]